MPSSVPVASRAARAARSFRSRLATFASATLALLLLAGPALGGKGTKEDPWIVGMSQCNLAEPWRRQMNADLAKAAEGRPEIKLIFQDAQNDTQRQRAHIEEFAARPVDLLIVSPLETLPLTRPVSRTFKAGVPVIVLDREVQGEDYTLFIGGDNRKIGREAGRWIAGALGSGGRVVELTGLMTSSPAKDRHEGFLEGIAGSGVEVIFEADCKWLEANGRKEMESALARFPKIDLVYAHNDPAAHGAYLAARAAGRADAIRFVGIDALPHEGVAYVKEGLLAATFQYPTGGAEAIDHAVKILRGEKVPKRITLGTRIFTKENVAEGGAPIE